MLAAFLANINLIIILNSYEACKIKFKTPSLDLLGFVMIIMLVLNVNMFILSFSMLICYYVSMPCYCVNMLVFLLVKVTILVSAMR